MMNDDMKDAVDSLAEPTDPSIFVASNGLRLKLRRVSQGVMVDAARRIKAPRVPKVMMEDKGREEENPLDPDYIIAVRNYNFDLAMLAINTYFVLGTQIDSSAELPADVYPVASSEWSDLMEIVDPSTDIPATGPRRYLMWLRYHALTDADQNALLTQCIRYSGGTLEGDVAAAQSSFRGVASRDSAIGVLPGTEDRLRDFNGTNVGDGAGVRSEGSGGIRALPVERMDAPTAF